MSLFFFPPHVFSFLLETQGSLLKKPKTKIKPSLIDSVTNISLGDQTISFRFLCLLYSWNEFYALAPFIFNSLISFLKF